MKVKVNYPYRMFKGEDYLKELLSLRNIENVEDFLNPTAALLQEPEGLDNIDAGAELLLSVLRAEQRIWMVADCD